MRALLRGAAHVWAVDLAVEMRALPRDHVAVLGDAANVTLGRTFALILAAGIFEFVAPPRVLANAAAHAAPGARLVVLLGADTCGTALRTFHAGHGVDARLYAPKEFDEAALTSGWRIEECAHAGCSASPRATPGKRHEARPVPGERTRARQRCARCHAIMQKLGEAGVGCEVATSGNGQHSSAGRGRAGGAQVAALRHHA